MKIAFSGASGTGKTSIINEILKYIDDIEFVPVGARSVAKDMGFDTPYETDIASLFHYNEAIENGKTAKEAADISKLKYVDGIQTVRAIFQNMVQKTKIEWENSHMSTISDRSTIDDMVYSIMHCPEIVDDSFIERSIQHALTYDVIFLTYIEDFIKIGNDPNRVSDMKYHTTFQTKILDVIQSNHILYAKMVSVPHGSPHERAKFCIKYITST